MPIGGAREMLKHMRWCLLNPDATEEEYRAFIQSLIDDPDNTLKRAAAPASVRRPALNRADGGSPSTSGTD